MNTLPPELRRSLERVVVSAREVAEQGARAALEELAVHEPAPRRHMDDDQRELRRELRAHGRQIGDRHDAQSGAQGIERLTRECAYEHWHGMLFARFLAENNLLIDTMSEVPVTLAECEELARAEGLDKWSFAEGLAQCTLPHVFRAGHPAFSAPPAREHQQKLERLVEGLPPAVFQAADSLGWVYQFWQSRRKDEVNRSEVKIGADELPAVTQLFTEPYMVGFLLDNTLGAWWASGRLTMKDLAEAASEDELRRKAALPGVPLRYLRFVRGESGWRLAAGAFDDWPDNPAALKVLDPCCGSGHFLTAALAMLAPMRMELEGLAAAQAVDAVLRDNLAGLELDPRCVELAAFALALTAWTWPGAEGHRNLPKLRVACSGLAVGAARRPWSEFSAGRHNLRLALSWLYKSFREAPTLGSLLDPYADKAALLVDRQDLAFALDRALMYERSSDERREAVVAAQGLDEAAALLGGHYHLVATNVPYLGISRQSEKLREFVANRWPAAKNDLATVFLERCLELCAQGGTAALVLPQNWLFLTRYRNLRGKLLEGETWHLLARLGPGAFETISGEVVKAILLALSRGKSTEVNTMHGFDVSESRTAAEKAVQLIEAEINGIEQARQLKNPDARVVLEETPDTALLEKHSRAFQGISPADLPRYGKRFWEPMEIKDGWRWWQSTVENIMPFGGKSLVIQYGNLQEAIDSGHAYLRGVGAFDRQGVIVRQMTELPCALYSGDMFDTNCSAVIPHDTDHLPAIWCFCSSPEYNQAVRRIDQSLAVTNDTLVKVPFDLDHWQKIASEKYPHGLPRPYSDDPTQWIFHGHPCGSVVWDEAAKYTACGPPRADAAVLQTAVARLLGYRWPAERDEAMELAEEQREWTRRCAALLPFADADGIVCIPSVRGEAAAAERLLQLLAAAYGDAWNEGVPARLLAAAGAADLDDWLRNRFFEQHCKLFHQRPFVWHVWDGRRRDGFHALLSWHKLGAGGGAGRRLLEALTWSYLGDWIERRRDGVKRGEGGAEDRLAAALELQRRLAAILEGEPPWDVFARWKPLAEQPIGWEPDVNDGVRVNIRPFLADDVPGGKKGAGILRHKPNIHWRKDRGKEPPRGAASFPWFYDAEGRFRGERVNDVHLKVADKRAARQQAEGER